MFVNMYLHQTITKYVSIQKTHHLAKFSNQLTTRSVDCSHYKSFCIKITITITFYDPFPIKIQLMLQKHMLTIPVPVMPLREHGNIK